MWMRVVVLREISRFVLASLAQSDRSVTRSENLFYRDNVALFSGTGQSSIDGDSLQTVLDVFRTGSESNMIFEPGIFCSNAITTGPGAFSLKPLGGVLRNPQPQYQGWGRHHPSLVSSQRVTTERAASIHYVGGVHHPGG